MKSSIRRKSLYDLMILLLMASASTGLRAAPGDSSNARLQELVIEAARNNPEIRAAKSERDAAQQRILPAGALDDPVLEAGIVNAPLASQAFRREDMTMKMLGLSQKLPYPGKRGLRQEFAQKDAESVAYAYEETVNRVMRDLKLAYFELSLIDESARLVGMNRQVLDGFLKISESRYSVGQGSQADVLKAQTQLSRMMDELIKLDRERHTVEAELIRVLGRGAGSGAPLPAALRVPEGAPKFEPLLEAAHKERPLLRGLKSLVDRSAKALDLARADFYPDFDVKFAYGQRDKTLEGFRRDDMVSVTVAINLPVWRENKREPRVAEAVAMRNQALDTYQAQQNELSAKLRRQVASVEQSLKSAHLYRTAILPQARLAVEASLAAYRVNRVDFLTLLDNQITVFNSEIGYASLLANYSKALVEIDFLTGKPAS